mmetsp:Transcript_49231/g.117159  ORF Transcript_49231/g.117159 Transcript_49231/m.117159 type:complete len:262 (+) Transcript_49231:57-842(+)
MGSGRPWIVFVVSVLAIRTYGLKADGFTAFRSDGKAPVVASLPTNEKMRVDIYYETLCPDCQELIGKKLLAIWNDPAFRAALDIHLHPSGNVEVTGEGDAREITCQHGEAECYGNALHACAMKVMAQEDYMPVIMCMEAAHPSSVDSLNLALTSCATAQNVSSERVQACMADKQVNTMMLGHYQDTEALKPPHEWVPWVLLDGQHERHADMGKLRDTICKRFEESGDGTQLTACRAVGLTDVSQANPVGASEPCYAKPMAK